MEKGENAKFIRSLLKNVLDAKSIKDSWSHFREANDTVETLLLEASMSETQEVNSTRYSISLDLFISSLFKFVLFVYEYSFCRM